MREFVTEEHKKSAVAAVKELIQIPSVLDEEDSGTGHPFGKQVVKALDKVLEICKDLGFETFKDPEGYYGYAEIGSGKELFGLLCHMDVVPAGDEKNWKTGPFEPTIKDGELIGRGSQDDKGPTMAALFAVKALMDAGVTFNCRIRFIFGTDEETLWRCLDRYNEKEESITQGFAPDAEFPLIYAEKGLLQAYLVGPGTDEIAVSAPGALNVVPNEAPYSGTKLAEVKASLDKLGFPYEETENGIIVQGQSVHAKDAVEGKNAITRLAMALSDITDFKPIEFLGKVVKENATGENVVGVVKDEQSGQLTMNFASLEITPEQTKIGVDMRIPVTIEKKALVKQLSEAIVPYGLTYEEFDFLDSLYVPLDSKLIKNLLGTYRDITGDMTEPIVSGGATFARTMNQCVAFGAMFPDTPDYMHQANERWELNSMYRAMTIYAEAIYRLCGK
ncbi:MAG: M20 family metallopeptidase [Lactobacillales bacterium]|jgi:predicted dipeptidase|nr:M20 family metallopeptidase [Lactobacillales bacterium]